MRSLISTVVFAMSLPVLAGDFVATMSSTFRGTSSSNSHVFTITQSGNANWEVKEFKGCPAYPCSEADFTETKLVEPKLLTSPEASEGNAKVQLGPNMLLEVISILGKAPDYELNLLNADGTVSEKVKLMFFPTFGNRELKP